MLSLKNCKVSFCLPAEVWLFQLQLHVQTMWPNYALHNAATLWLHHQQTKRIYAWNVNHGGHYPVLELRPVRIEHVKNIELMRQYHENDAYDLGVKIVREIAYEI